MTRATKVKKINLALQGGGAHGAFTWGVLDRLVEDERIVIEGISATSAGGTNGVAFSYGMAKGGREGAKRVLYDFWRSLSRVGSPSILPPGEFERAVKVFWKESMKTMQSMFPMLGKMQVMISPYEFNPFNINPLKQLLEQSIDFRVLRGEGCPVKLFLCATNVRTGRIKIFDRREITTDCVLASACLPTLFQAVEIGGESYWDGGYVGNPALFPLIYNCESRDVAVVHINPQERTTVPKSAPEILARINEISFSSSLLRELRVIAFLTKLVDDGLADGTKLRHVLIHEIASEEIASELSVESMVNMEWDFLTRLRDAGRHQADVWLAANFDRLGETSTIDVQKKYGDAVPQGHRLEQAVRYDAFRFGPDA
jgi:NTE family protein